MLQLSNNVPPVPDEIYLRIFSFLELKDLITCHRVNSRWRSIASNLSLWKQPIYDKLAFGSQKWTYYCGENVIGTSDSEKEFSTFPVDKVIEECRNFKKAFPLKNLKKNLIVVWCDATLNGGLSIDNISKLANSCNSCIYRIVNLNEGTAINSSFWGIMITEVTPEEKSDPITYLAQKKLKNYRLPTTIEAITFVFAHRLFFAPTIINAPCQGKIFGEQIKVFANDGSISILTGASINSVAVVKKLSS